MTIARLVVRPFMPTPHDVEVVSHLTWRADRSDQQNQDAIDRALDVERVTKRFFVELNVHYHRIVEAVAEEAHSPPPLLVEDWGSSAYAVTSRARFARTPRA